MANNLNDHKIWNKLKAVITDNDLRWIAAADYADKKEQHYVALKAIYEQGEVPIPFGWVPGEVVELIRWSSGYSSDNRHGFEVKLFCACLLLEPVRNEGNQGDGQNQNIIIAVDCAAQLGRDWLEALHDFLERLYLNAARKTLGYEIIFFPLGLLLINCLLEEQVTALQLWIKQLLDDEDKMLEAEESWLASTQIEIKQLFDGEDKMLRAEESQVGSTQIENGYDDAVFNPRKVNILDYTMHDLRHDLWRQYLGQAKPCLEITGWRHSQ